MSNWTDEQRSAIDARGCSLIVSAAAGSGKTSVLVERLINIIAEDDEEKRVPVEKMIVVTFTNAAAAEMKQRLSAELSKRINDTPGNSWLVRQSSMLGCAAISTISSFCIDLLRKNICRLSLSSGFRIVEETEEAIFMKDAYKNISDSFYKNRRSDMLLLRNNFCGTNDSQLEYLIYGLYSVISSAPFFEQWLDDAMKKYQSGEYEREYENIIQADVKKCLGMLAKAENDANILAQQDVIDIVDSDKSAFERAYKKLGTNGYDEFSKAVSDISFKAFPAGKTADRTPGRKRLKDLREIYKKLIQDISGELSNYCGYMNDKPKIIKLMGIISDFLIQFDAELSAIKSRKNVLGFDDAERLVLKLLTEVKENGEIEKTPLAQELSDYYRLIMIDEFQDANNRQDMIFRLLSKGGTSEKYGNNLFFVGDVKQSIYRFRLANPNNFINAVKNSEKYSEGNGGNMSYIRLSKNFRSSKEVIDISNYVFSCIMSQKCGEVDYNQDEYLYQGAFLNETGKKPDRKPVIMLFDGSDRSVENIEAKCVAEKISEMLANKVPVSSDGGRPCKMSDFCILTRGNRELGIYADELAALGINAQYGTEAGYLRSREVSVMVNLLSVIDNPCLDVPLMSVMLSPMFMFTPDDAVRLRLIDTKAPLYTNLLTGIGTKRKATPGSGQEAQDMQNEEPVFDGVLLDKARLLYSIITELRLYASAYTLQELVRRIYDSTDFMSVIQLYGDGERKEANLRMLLEYVGNYEQNNDGGLPGFIRYIDRVADSGKDLAAAPDTKGMQNAVSVRTMHKSKGLEYPFVFIAGTGKEFNREDSRKAFQFSYERGLGFRLQDPVKYERCKSLPYDLLDRHNRLSSVSEEMRLLYVAMTRAKERLFITMNCNDSAAKKAAVYADNIESCNGITPELAASVNCMADWLLMCMVSHGNSVYLRNDVFGISKNFNNGNNFEAEYEKYSPKTAAAVQSVKCAVNSEEADEEQVRRLTEMFSFRYDRTLSTLTAKQSVSDMAKSDTAKKDEKTVYINLRSPDFSDSTKALTGAERGTALHRFFQFADFDKLETDINAERERLFEGGYLNERQKNSVKESSVRNFMGSKLYERIKKAKKVYREKKFLIAIDDLGLTDDYGEKYRGTSGMLNGIIDMVLEFDDHLVLVDYKTDHVSDIHELEERYSPQLDLYKRALGKTETKPVTETLIYSFDKNDELSILNDK